MPADQNSRPAKTDHQEMDWSGVNPISYQPGYPEMSESFGQPGNAVTLDHVKLGYKPGG